MLGTDVARNEIGSFVQRIWPAETQVAVCSRKSKMSSQPQVTVSPGDNLRPNSLAHHFSSIRVLLSLVAVCGIGCVLVLPYDAAVSGASRREDLPGDLAKAVQLSEVFGHSLGAGAILLTTLVVAQSRRKQLIGAVLITLTAGLTANALKGSVSRVRPHSVPLIEVVQELEENIGQAPPTSSERGSTAGKEGSLSPERVPIDQLRFWDSRQRSFPSGHSATAWGLALGLSLAFPRGAALFAFFACLACFQRLFSGAHYLSDVLAGAGIAFMWGCFWYAISRRSQRLLPLFSLPRRPVAAWANVDGTRAAAPLDAP